jgi:hypothetical protein
MRCLLEALGGLRRELEALNSTLLFSVAEPEVEIRRVVKVGGKKKEDGTECKCSLWRTEHALRACVLALTIGGAKGMAGLETTTSQSAHGAGACGSLQQGDPPLPPGNRP